MYSPCFTDQAAWRQTKDDGKLGSKGKNEVAAWFELLFAHMPGDKKRVNEVRMAGLRAEDGSRYLSNTKH
jgi:hypothetical protein